MTILIDILAPPTFGEVSSSFIVLREGDDLDLVCLGQGTPKPSASWSKDGLELISTSRLNVTHGRVTASTPIVASDAGLYVCTLKNVAGHITHTTKVVIEGKLTSGSLKIILFVV